MTTFKTEYIYRYRIITLWLCPIKKNAVLRSKRIKYNLHEGLNPINLHTVFYSSVSGWS